jgi:hypothetical protein
LLNIFFHLSVTSYIEIELGPHGHHIILFLDGNRNAVAKLLPIQYEATIGNLQFNKSSNNRFSSHHINDADAESFKSFWSWLGEAGSS